MNAKFALPGLMTPSASIKAATPVELRADGSVHLALDFLEDTTPVQVHLGQAAWTDTVPPLLWSELTGRYVIKEKDGLHLRVPRWLLPLRDGMFEFWIWQGGESWRIQFAGRALWETLLSPSAAEAVAPESGPAYVEGEAAIAVVDDEQIQVVFAAPFLLTPSKMPLISPLSPMPGWVLPETVSAAGFTIQLAGPGPAGTRFAYRQSL